MTIKRLVRHADPAAALFLPFHPLSFHPLQHGRTRTAILVTEGKLPLLVVRGDGHRGDPTARAGAPEVKPVSLLHFDGGAIT